MWNPDMKKMITLNHSKEGQEKSKKIYRSISERVKTLDDTRGCATSIKDLFQPSVQIQRSRLQEYCERLIFSEPLSFGLKAEELLWRKVYYEVIATAKRLKKSEYNIEEKSALINHINAGIGHYHHYISRLQTEFEISFESQTTIDFYIINQKSTKRSDLSNKKKESDENELEEWCLSSVHRSCIYLGDLCRYKLEIYPNFDPNLAIRYYSQALLMKPEFGMPHNQMGTLATSLNQHLDATYHYIQCLMSKNSFEGTENNLHRLFEKNAQYIESLPVETSDGATDSIAQLEPTEQVRRFLARFLLLADVWFFNKKIPHIYDLCHQTNLDLQECLSFLRPVSSESGDSQNGDHTDTESITESHAAYLTSDMIFKIIVICLQCITKLQGSNNSHQLSNVIAFTLAVYSQLVQHVTGRIQESILNFPLQESKITRKKLKLFARRRKKIGDNEDSESDPEVELDSPSGSEDEPEVELLASSSDDELVDDEDDDRDVIIETKDTSKETLAKLKLIEVKDVLDIILEETYLGSIKILSDWLRSDVDVLRNCGKSTRSLFSQLVYLFNLINIDLKKIKNACKLNVVQTPLTEDILLKDMEVVACGQQGLDWKMYGKRQDEGLVRICKLIQFGQFLEEHVETGVSYDGKSRMFHVDMRSVDGDDISPTTIEDLEAFDANLPTENNAGVKVNDRDNKRQLMKHMGQLWLAAEVRDLESRVKGKMSLSPYLVVDVEALIKHMDMVKQLVYSRKFLILVPTTVLCALDDLKKIKSEAREVIRWLESQFRQGNRFFRLQRHHERLTLPLIKYPKKKEKEAVVHIQIIECCHFLAEQEKRGGANLVTLLMGGAMTGGVMGGADSTKEFSYVGLAQSVGVNVELISEFYAKWKKNSKGGKGR